MKRVEVDFVALERKYEWSYADNDKSAVDWLLQLSSKYQIKINVIDGFNAEETEILANLKNYRKMHHPTINDLINNTMAS